MRLLGELYITYFEHPNDNSGIQRVDGQYHQALWAS